VNFATVVATVASSAHTHFAFDAAWRALFLIALSAAYEEASGRVEALRFRVGAEVRSDMSSVWIVAAALALSPAYAVSVVVGVRTCMWFSHMKKSGMKLYRQVFTGATMVLGCLAAGGVLREFGYRPGHLTSELSAAFAILAVVVTYIVVNRGLVVSGVSVASGSFAPKNFGLGWEEEIVEVATVSLGGVAAVLLSGYPWLMVLILAPMFALQRAALVKEFRQAAMTDAKTGLLNAVAWQALAQRELLRAKRDKTDAGLLIVDLDFFKSVNDSYGHLAGDTVLKSVAECLRTELRDYDAIGRFGGEEFVALLPGASEFESLRVADRVRAAVSRIRLPEIADGAPMARLTSSIGIACYPEHGDELEELLRAADSAMYAAKRTGRDRAIVFSSVPGSADGFGFS
jgi:diguanylate cyclase (GGDEF)-like protein